MAGSKKYASILSSVKELGVVEPLVVHPKPLIEDGVSSYMLLDGHLRLEALKALGAEQALCLVSTDDEGFTYNRHINRLTPIQEHKMIVSAMKRGSRQNELPGCSVSTWIVSTSVNTC